MKKPSGFTLVEIAIVLVIIGLLLGGVLKGQELINNAKIKNVVNDFNSVGAAVYTYQDRYKALPGDDAAATDRWSTAPKGNRNGILDAETGGVDETKAFWQHLRLAGLITGDAAKDDPPFNAANGLTTVVLSETGSAGFKGGVIVCTSSLPGKLAEAVDSQLDDGKPSTGTVRATNAVSGSVYSDDGATTYTICKQI